MYRALVSSVRFLQAFVSRLQVLAERAEHKAFTVRKEANMKRLIAATDAATAARKAADRAGTQLAMARHAYNVETVSIKDAHPSFA